MRKVWLTGDDWLVRDTEGEFSMRGSVPGVVQADLVKNGLLPHPYVGTNEDLFIQLEDKEWIYEKDFSFVEPLGGEDHVDLVFEGIDTLSDVYLNDVFLGCTEDMFLEYRFDVKHLLKKENKLKVHIKSPVSVPRALEQNYGKLGGPEESVRGYIRKAQYSYGWDWGARIVTSGIWKPVYLELHKGARLHDSTAYLIEYEEGESTIKVTGYVASRVGRNDLSVAVFVDGKLLGEYEVQEREGELFFEGIVKVKGLKLWYPWNVGDPHLYNFDFVLKKGEDEIYRESKRIGFRKVRIIQEPDEEGKTFIFEVNGERVFAKGANWIPAENVLTWLSEDDYKKLLKMAKDANMNMLRVWGGGIYEHEAFYSLCDEMGIMVWQDFMYACLEYPDHLPWFRKLANEEARRIVRKLRHHACIVLWCGNNENNWGFEEWGIMNRKVDGLNLGNRLYLFDFPKICAEEDPKTPYWVSSPYGGERANSEREGDRHVWNVWSGWVNYDQYEREGGKFISEFGFQGAPHPKTIEFFAKEDERRVFHPVMLKHNKQVEGQERLVRFIVGNFGEYGDFEDFVYLSQLNQAEAIKFGVEHWRSRKYKTAGTLFWQLNDSWPVFSWSAVDYFKRPKALYYYAKRFFADVLPVLKRSGNGITFLVVSDLRKTVNAKAVLSAYSFDGRERLVREYNITLPADSVVIVDNFGFSDENVVFFMDVEVEGKVFSNYKVFKKWRDLKLEDPEIEASVDGRSLTLKAKKPAFGVKILSENDEELEDNFLFLKPFEERKIELAGEFYTVRSLYDYLKKR